MTLPDFKTFPYLNLKYSFSKIGYVHEKQENIDFKGLIYVFYNNLTYSAAGSLVNMCYYFDNLIAVGEPTGQVLGFGLQPQVFELQNSKIKFRIAPTIDLTNVNTIESIYHDKPEIDINASLDEKILLKNNDFSIEYIKSQDPYFKRINND